MAIALPVVAADLVPILRSVAVTTPTTLNPEVKLDLELLFEERIDKLKEHSLDISKEQLLNFYKISD